MTLAPAANGEIVTSQRSVVASVDVNACSVLACMDDGREHRLGPDDIAADRLAHGYATTVHRSQGAPSTPPTSSPTVVDASSATSR